MFIVYSIVLLFVSNTISAKVLTPGQQIQGKIVGGQETDIDLAPYTASIHAPFLTTYTQFLGGGAIISQWFVITSARILLPFESDEFTVRVGSSYTKMYGQEIKVAEYTCRPEATDADDNIALLRLAKSIVFGPSAYPIALPFADEKLPYGSVATITGWGYVGFGPLEGYSHKLKKLSAAIWTDTEKCKAMVPTFYVSENVFCAGEEDTTCIGDDGGPLVVNDVLVGIVSSSLGCRNFTSAYMKVSSQVDWIISVIEKSYTRNPGVVSNKLDDLLNIKRSSSDNQARIIKSCNVDKFTNNRK